MDPVMGVLNRYRYIMDSTVVRIFVAGKGHVMRSECLPAGTLRYRLFPTRREELFDGFHAQEPDMYKLYRALSLLCSVSSSWRKNSH